MSVYIDTRGHTTLAVGICARCSVKYARDELTPDPNFPGLMVCPDGCKDTLDPYRLPARQSDRLAVDQPRPDVSLSASAVIPIYPKPIDGMTSLGITTTWTKSTNYSVGNTVTPLTPNYPTDVPQNWFGCIQAGTSGAVAPVWKTAAGTTVTDGTVRWLNLGVFVI